MITYKSEFHLQDIKGTYIFIYFVDETYYATTGIGLGALDGEGAFFVNGRKVLYEKLKAEKPKLGTIVPVRHNNMNILLLIAKDIFINSVDKTLIREMFKMILKTYSKNRNDIVFKIVANVSDYDNVSHILENIDDKLQTKNIHFNFELYGR